MALEEAIKHCIELAEKNEEECKNWTYGASRINDDESRKKQYLKHAEMWQECASEHRQLAEWLRELNAYRDGCHCDTCKYLDKNIKNRPCGYCGDNESKWEYGGKR